MFTGIIEELGNILSSEKSSGSLVITIEAERTAREVKINDSVCVNGVCQTVIERGETSFTVQAVEETLTKTALANLKKASRVNLELPLRIGDRLGGHFVQGHVDCVGSIISIQKRESSWLVTVQIPELFKRYVVPIGSIAIDGVSLTVASVKDCDVTVSIIPHTLDNTIFADYEKGSHVNLEFDIIGKYVEKQLSGETGTGGKNLLSEEKLKEWGYGN